jgi:lipopolysaccharide/colanic/teichoic acid biosynthesis glycosyltransferase
MRRLQGQLVYDEIFETTDGISVVIEVSEPAQALQLSELPLASWRYRFVKRALDIVCAVLMIVGFAIPGLLICLLIRLTSPYPVFYSEERIGRNEVPFRIWKFRSMRPHAPSPRAAEVLHFRIDKNKHDPRITKMGRFLRRWSLDEVPQLFNVLRGEMSLIGPRPVVKAETYLYKHLLPFYLAAKPGLSGLWQISGRSDLDYDRRAQLDAIYVQGWSLRSDFKIFLKTIPAVLGRVGAR